MKALTISWAKELQLRIPGVLDPELLPHLIQGAGPVAYYSVFHSARALFIAAEQDVRARHSSALAALASWAKDRDIFPPPWCVYIEGGPQRSAMHLGGLPAFASLAPDTHNLRRPSPEAVWNSVQMLLETTRDRQIRERKEEWRKDRRKRRVPTAESARIASKVPATTIFTVLWRLRRRSDYADASAFVEGVDSPTRASEYQDAVSDLVGGTLTILESIVVAYAGPDLYAEASERFLLKTRRVASQGLALRRTLILSGP